jgi:hypothetical protein
MVEARYDYDRKDKCKNISKIRPHYIFISLTPHLSRYARNVNSFFHQGTRGQGGADGIMFIVE